MNEKQRTRIREIRKIIEDKITGRWIACHDEFGHHYRHVATGVVVDSVTTMNMMPKPHLSAWSAGVAIEFLEEGDNWQKLKDPLQHDAIFEAAKFRHTDLRDEAGDVGTAAHKMIELYCQDWIHTGMRPPSILRYVPEGIDPRAIAAARCAENFLVKEELVPIASELTVGITGVSAGNLDLIALNKDNKIELVDWKTSNAIDIFYALQTAAYRKFFIEMCKEDGKVSLSIKKIRIVKLDKFSDRPKVYWVPNPTFAYKMFLHNVDLYNYKNSGVDPIPADKVIITI